MLTKSCCIQAGLCLALSLAAGAAAAAEADTNSVWPAMRPLGRGIPAARDGDAPAAGAAGAQAHEPEGELTLKQALELALRHSPELAAASHEVLAAEGGLRQSGTLPNPELEIEAEEFAGSGSREGYDAAETTVRLTQTIGLGGKRGERRHVAQLEARLAGWAYEAQRMDVFTDTTKAYVGVLKAQGRLALAESVAALAEDVRKTAAERVKAGDVPPIEETKAGVEAIDARIARDRAKRELDQARRQLATSWGGVAARFKEASGNLDNVGDVPPLETLAAGLDEVPEVARWNEELALARGELALAQSERAPDLAVGVGVSRFEDDDSYAGTASLSLPLPLFDRNTGGISESRHRLVRTEFEQHAARLRAMTDLVEAYNRLETARAEAVALKGELLPGARQVFEAAQTGYREGKFGQLEVLDAQRTLGEAQARHLEALAVYHEAAADVARLTGAPLNVGIEAK